MNVALVSKLSSVIDAGYFKLSNVLPSEWAEGHRVMTSDVSSFAPGPFRYRPTPYLREIVDCLSPAHPARVVSVMKGAQIGFSAGVIENGIGYIISEQPGNILFLSGHAQLSEEAMVTKVDQMIDSCGLRPLIRPNTLRKRNTRTGDTNKSKEFPGGSLVSGSANNHKLLRQRSIRYGFIDDFDAVKKTSKESGNVMGLIIQRFATSSLKMKLFFISTPELKSVSNIEPAFLMGDRRKYMIPCLKCGEGIPLEWDIEIEGEENERGGIYYKTDGNGHLIKGSVGYVCQMCGGFFSESHKYDAMNSDVCYWQPTAEPDREGYYSYHISSLYAPAGMFNWEHYVYEYLKACPPNRPRDEGEYKTFINLCLGLPYEEVGEAPDANKLQKNIMGYAIGNLPEKHSLKHGNGHIILITCACDLNGVVDDARLDYEVVAWTESGTSYSIDHGSIGTFIPRENQLAYKEDRKPYTYRMHQPNSVWPILDEVLSTIFISDTGRKMRIAITGIDVGHYDNFAWEYMDSSNFATFGLKGAREGRYSRYDTSVQKKYFTASMRRQNLYLLESNAIKDEIAKMVNLNFDERDDSQPAGFMNFPTPADGKYLFKNYFEHFQAEHKVQKEEGGQHVGWAWVKKSSAVQNHLFDCRCYNFALREIMAVLICRESKISPAGWADYVELLKNARQK